MYSATFLIAVHPSSVTSSISHRSTVTSTWREVRTRASRRPSSSSVNRPQATTYGRDSGFPILSMTAMTGNRGISKPAAQSDHLGSHTAEGLLPRIPTECGLLRLAVRRGLPVRAVPPTGPTFNRPHRDRGSGAGLLEDRDGCRLLDLARASSTPPSTMVTNIASPFRLDRGLAVRRPGCAIRDCSQARGRRCRCTLCARVKVTAGRYGSPSPSLQGLPGKEPGPTSRGLGVDLDLVVEGRSADREREAG